MICDICGQEDLPDRRSFVGLNARNMPMMHYECPIGHCWHHLLLADPNTDTPREACDCWDA